MHAISESTPAGEWPATGLRSHLEIILSRYEAARVYEPFGRRHELWQAFRSLAQELSTQPAVARRPALEVSWSMGQKHWLKIPWVAFLDRRETRSRQEGLYCALLFRQDMTGVYLMLNQGIARLKREVGRDVARIRVRERATELRTLCGGLSTRGFRLDDLIDLRTDPALAADYDASTVAYKLYERWALPPDEEITADLEALLDVYDRCLDTRDRYSAGTAAAAVREERGKEARTTAFERQAAVEARLGELRESCPA